MAHLRHGRCGKCRHHQSSGFAFTGRRLPPSPFDHLGNSHPAWACGDITLTIICRSCWAYDPLPGQPPIHADSAWIGSATRPRRLAKDRLTDPTKPDRLSRDPAPLWGSRDATYLSCRKLLVLRYPPSPSDHLWNPHRPSAWRAPRSLTVEACSACDPRPGRSRSTPEVRHHVCAVRADRLTIPTKPVDHPQETRTTSGLAVHHHVSLSKLARLTIQTSLLDPTRETYRHLRHAPTALTGLTIPPKPVDPSRKPAPPFGLAGHHTVSPVEGCSAITDLRPCHLAHIGKPGPSSVSHLLQCSSECDHRCDNRKQSPEPMSEFTQLERQCSPDYRPSDE
jgi:hypothetical protein